MVTDAKSGRPVAMAALKQELENPNFAGCFQLNLSSLKDGEYVVDFFYPAEDESRILQHDQKFVIRDEKITSVPR